MRGRSPVGPGRRRDADLLAVFGPRVPGVPLGGQRLPGVGEGWIGESSFIEQSDLGVSGRGGPRRSDAGSKYKAAPGSTGPRVTSKAGGVSAFPPRAGTRIDSDLEARRSRYDELIRGSGEGCPGTVCGSPSR